MATKNALPTNQRTTELDALPAKILAGGTEPLKPRWHHWRQSGYCRLWMAVVLTMNIEPPKKSIHLEAMLSTEEYQEYKDRKIVAIRQYGNLLPSSNHHATGELHAEKYVSLPDMLLFAQKLGWGNLDPMTEGVTGQTSKQSSLATAETNDVLHSAELNPTSKGERYSLVRSGALLELLGQWALDGGRIPNDCIRAGLINFSWLAKQVNAVIATKARANGKDNFSGFGVDVTRKEFGKAKQELEDYFGE